MQTTNANSPLLSPLVEGGSRSKATGGSYVSENLLHIPDVRLPYNPSFKDRAREMRKNMTTAEKIMWKEILPGITQYRFLRQRPIHHYIVDFYCPKLHLVIEIDGDSHDSDEAKEYDQTRTTILGNYGIEVIRYKNEDVILHSHKVIKNLQNKLYDREKSHNSN